MKLYKRDKPSHFSVIDALDGNRYILIRHMFAGYSIYDNYTVYKWNPELQNIDKKPICEIMAHRSNLKTYAPYLFHAHMLVAFGVYSGMLALSGRITIDHVLLDALYNAYVQAYAHGAIDNDLSIAP